MPFTSLVDIWTSRPDLKKAFPQGTQSGTTDNAKLYQWWNQYGTNEYPGVTLVAPGSVNIQNPTTLTQEAQASAQQQTAQAPTGKTTGTAGTADMTSQIEQIYINNFGRYPTQTELNDQISAIQSGRLTIDALTNWAQTNPQNITQTGVVSEPQPFQGQKLGTSRLETMLTDPTFKAAWDAATPAERALFESASTIVQGQIDAGASNVAVNQDLMNKALDLAASDLRITAKYGDAAIIAKADLQNSLSYLGAEYQQQAGITSEQQKLARQQLAESEAAAGRAQSGLRKQAEQRLATEQTGVVQSAQRQLQQQVRAQGAAYESQYGTAATPSISAAGQTYQPYGGIVGTVPMAQKADIQTLTQGEIYPSIANPTTK